MIEAEEKIPKTSAKQVVHNCATCLRSLVDEYYVQCNKCHGFIQCLECFAYGYEKEKHLRTHPFVLMEPKEPSIYTSDWTIEEELLLLNAIELNGLGNWVEIAKWVKSKSEQECESHYFGVYCDHELSPHPEIKVKEPFPGPQPLNFDTTPTESCPSCGHEKNLQMNNKRDKTVPAEFCGYMPRRGEFEDEFNDEAEHIIDGLTFDDNDTAQQIEEKLKSLLVYNSQLEERRLRTKVVEDWNIHYNQFKSLGGTTQAEKEIDSKILTLSSYLGKKKVKLLAKQIHQLRRDIETIENRQKWQANGVKTHHEGFLFTSLENLIRNDTIPDSEANRWNAAIKQYNNDHGKSDTEDAKLLSEKENELCKREDIQPPIYVAMKDMVIREFSIRGGLTKQEAIDLLPDQAKQMSAIYDLFVSVMWIHE